jgi:hypothetical protein
MAKHMFAGDWTSDKLERVRKEPRASRRCLSLQECAEEIS